eukprot:m.238002 g.238002  ORF g.238002 m.238002 type:complete len:323 (-) comp54343_c1_seq4:158-1126(-)
MSGSVFELLAGGFPFERTVVTLDSLTPVDQAFKTLADAHVSSAPVFDQQANAYIGFFDINDMVAYVVKMLHHSGDAAPLPESFRDMHHFLSTLTHFVPVEVAQIANLSKNNPFLPVYDDTPFLEVLEILGRHAVHRVPVVDRASGRVTRLITQSAVVKYLAKNLNELQPLSENTVASTSLGLKTVFSVACDAPVLQAFETLVANKITGVALVDTTGVIVTALSSSDLRVLTTGHKFRLKGITALQLVQKSRALEANARPAIVCARLTTHLSEIASKLAATGLHRIFILDDQENPIGVISVRDLIRFILPYFTKKTYDWAHRA